MGFKDTILEPYHGRLEGFTNHKVGAKGTVDLELEVGEHPFRSKATVTFVFMDLTSDYHTILGIPSQAKHGLVASLPHQRVKFHTRAGIGCVRANAKDFLEHVVKSRKASKSVEIDTPEDNIKISKCLKTTHTSSRMSYIREILEEEPLVLETAADQGIVPPFPETDPILINGQNSGVNPDLRIVDLPDVDELMQEEGLDINDNEGRRLREIIIEFLEFRDGPEMEPVDKLEGVVINPDYPEQKIKLGGQLSPEEKEEIISLLKNSLDVFAWRVEDMRGINEEVALHRLEVDPLAKTISQTRRIFARDKEEAIKEEV